MTNQYPCYWIPPTLNYSLHSDQQHLIDSLRVEPIVNTTSLRLHEEKWDALAQQSTATIFQTFAWQYNWWIHFGNQPEHHLIALFIWSDDQLIGIAPFFIQSSNWHGYRIYSRLMLLGSGLQEADSTVPTLEREGPSDYLDIMAKVGHEHIVSQAVAHYLTDHAYLWDEINLQNIQEDGIIFKHLVPLLTKQEYRVKRTVTDICPKVSWTDLANIGTSDGESNDASMAHLLNDPEWTVKSMQKQGQLQGALQSLQNMQLNRLKSKGYFSPFSDDRFEAFQRDVTHDLASKGWAWAKYVRYNGNNLATYLGFEFNGRAYSYLSDLDLSQMSGLQRIVDPDSPFFMQLIKESNTIHYNMLDWGRGHQPSSLQYASQFTRNWEFNIRPPRYLATAQRSQHPGHHLVQRINQWGLQWKAYLKFESNIFKIARQESHPLTTIPKYLMQCFRRGRNRISNHRWLSKQGISRKKQSGNALNVETNIEFTAHTEATNSRSYSVETITDPSTFLALLQEWQDLANNYTTPLLTTDWFISAWEAFKATYQLHVIAIRRHGNLVALAPLGIKGKFRPRLELLGSSTLREPGGFFYRDTDALQMLVKQIIATGKPILLKGFHLFSPEVKQMEEMLSKGSYLSLIHEQRIPFVAINKPWRDYEKDHISSSRRSSLRRLRKKADQEGTITFEAIIPQPSDVDSYLNEVYRVEAANWKGKSGTAISTHPTLATFFRRYAHRLANQNQLRLFYLKIDDQTIAVQFTVVYANRLWIYKIGHDEAWNHLSPGILLMNEVVRYAFEQQLSGCEFLGHDESWLHIWANDFHSLANYNIYAKAIRGLVDFSWDHSKSYYHTWKAKLRHKRIH